MVCECVVCECVVFNGMCAYVWCMCVYVFVVYVVCSVHGIYVCVCGEVYDAYVYNICT